MINFKLIIVNILLSSSFMMFFVYFFYFYFIVKIENEKLNNIVAIKLIPKKYITKGKIKNKVLVEKAKKIVIIYCCSGFFLGFLLTFLFNLSFKDTIKYNLYLIMITILIEIIFIYLFVVNVGIFDNNDKIWAQYEGFTKAYNDPLINCSNRNIPNQQPILN